MATSSTRISLGHLGFWQRGNSVRVRGHKGFERVGPKVKRYIQQVQVAYRTAIAKGLPKALQSFMDTQLRVGTMPWETGNLHDSMAGVIIYKNAGGAYTIGKVVTAKPVASQPQKWGASLGGFDKDFSGKRYVGYGRSYAKLFKDDAEDSLGAGALMNYDLQIFLEATIPYASPLENNPGPCEMWLTELSDTFTDYIRLRTGIIVDRKNKTDILGGFTEWGIQAEIGF